LTVGPPDVPGPRYLPRGQAFGDDIGAAELAVLEGWRLATASLPESMRPPGVAVRARGLTGPSGARRLALASAQALVVFIDEIDALRDDVLVSVLRQLRWGYAQRPDRFPWSLALVGLRDVRDYEIATRDDDRLGTASPFNIKAESLTLAGFSRDEVAELYSQHTAQTGQAFDPAAIDRAQGVATFQNAATKTRSGLRRHPRTTPTFNPATPSAMRCVPIFTSGSATSDSTRIEFDVGL